MTEATPATRLPRRALAKNFSSAEFRHTSWAFTLDAGMTLGDAMEEAFWSNIAARVKPGDTIEVRNDENTIFARLYVRDSSKQWVKVALIEAHDFAAKVEMAPADAAAFDLKWNVGKKSYDVIRKADKTVVASDFKLKEDAAAWVGDHLKAMAA